MAKGPNGKSHFTLDSDGDGTGQSISGDGNGNGGTSDGSTEYNGAIDPASLAAGTDASGANGGATAKRKRGRPPGSGAKAKENVHIDVGSVETILFNVHAMVAAATGYDKVAINQEEASSLAKAVNNVQQFYPTHISAKALAWTNLFMVAGTIYGSRIVAIWADNKAAENNKPEAPLNNASVIDMRGMPLGPIR